MILGSRLREIVCFWLYIRAERWRSTSEGRQQLHCLYPGTGCWCDGGVQVPGWTTKSQQQLPQHASTSTSIALRDPGCIRDERLLLRNLRSFNTWSKVLKISCGTWSVLKSAGEAESKLVTSTSWINRSEKLVSDWLGHLWSCGEEEVLKQTPSWTILTNLSTTRWQCWASVITLHFSVMQ